MARHSRPVIRHPSPKGVRKGFFDSIFARPGSSAAQGQQRRQRKPAQLANDLLGTMSPELKQQFGFGASLEPGREDALRSLILSLQPGNLAATATRDKNAAFANAQRGATLSNATLQNQGLGSDFQAGNQSAFANQAVQQANNIDNQFNDPGYQANLHRQLLAALMTGQEAPGLNQFSSLAHIIYGQPTVQQGAGLGDLLGGALGQGLGSYASGLGGQNFGGN